MAPEQTFWFATILNRLLGAPVTHLLVKLGFPPADPLHPIPNYDASAILVLLLIFAGLAILRQRLSVENPGKFQQSMEVAIEFMQNLTDDTIGHGGRRYLPLIGTLGIFIVISNLLGLIPVMDTPTAHIQVPAGCAVVAFLYYNFHGLRAHGFFGYLKHLSGPIAVLALPIFVIEVFSNVLRLLSLSVRLWANMFVGGLVEKVFTGLIPLVVPSLFLALHVFESFLQAYIFMVLPAVYISLAISKEH